MHNDSEEAMNVPLYKGYENKDQRIVCLWLDHRLRIELIENIHIHFGNDGEFRVELSKNEFLQLSKGICAIPDEVFNG